MGGRAARRGDGAGRGAGGGGDEAGEGPCREAEEPGRGEDGGGVAGEEVRREGAADQDAQREAQEGVGRRTGRGVRERFGKENATSSAASQERCAELALPQ